MIFMNMEYPCKDYRVQVYDAWLGEELEPMDNPKDGDKIVYRVLGENGQPVEQKTEVYQNGAWVEQGGGGGGGGHTLTTLYDGDYESMPGPGFAMCMLTMDTTIETEPAELSVIYGGAEYTLPKIEGIPSYGDPSFENYPVAINLTGDVGYDTILLLTEQAESGSIIVSADLGGGSTSLYTDCVVTLNKTAGVSGDSVVALPSVEKNPNVPTYGIVGVCIYTDGSWSGGSYTCPLYDGNLTIFITSNGDKFQVASGDATTSVDGKEVYVHGDCTIDIIADK